MSDAPEAKPFTPRISVQGIETITDEHARYRNAGIAMFYIFSTASGEYLFSTRFGQEKLRHDFAFSPLERFLVEKDWYFVSVTRAAINAYQGDLYVPKPSVIAVTDIQAP